jgi:Glycosyl transferase family 11
MIVVRLRGRLGNQMFQYAAGRALAERCGAELVLDTSWIQQADSRDAWVRYELDCFDLVERKCPVWEVARVPNPSRLVYALQRLRPSRRRFVHVLAEDSATNAFLPQVLTAPDQTYLQGYLQFEGYFADQEAAIRSAFRFPPMSAESEQIAEDVGREPSVSIHVRRGDYTKFEQLGFLDADYYERALDRVTSHAGEVRPFVFSDDPDWCRENLPFAPRARIVDRPLTIERAWEDMCLMSMCDHHVIANSTYSWWGAWLNPSPSKLVVAPTTWVRSEKRAGDPIPARWPRV